MSSASRGQSPPYRLTLRVRHDWPQTKFQDPPVSTTDRAIRFIWYLARLIISGMLVYPADKCSKLSLRGSCTTPKSTHIFNDAVKFVWEANLATLHLGDCPPPGSNPYWVKVPAMIRGLAPPLTALYLTLWRHCQFSARGRFTRFFMTDSERPTMTSR